MELLSEFKNLIKNDLTKQVLKNYVKEILKKDRFKHIPDEQPFENCVGKLCYDYSGTVEKDNSIVINYNDIIENAFDEVYTGESRASYVSNCGLFYNTFLDELRDKWNSFKYEKYGIFLQNNKERIIDSYKIVDWEDVMDELDGTDIGDYLFFDSDDFFEEFVNSTTVQECLDQRK